MQRIEKIINVTSQNFFNFIIKLKIVAHRMLIINKTSHNALKVLRVMYPLNSVSIYSFKCGIILSA